MAILTTHIETGAVRGMPGGNPGCTVFRGIPYSAPTSGSNRFAPPGPADAWTGERLCSEFSDICLQPVLKLGMPFSEFFIKEFYPHNYRQSEDSLCLNIWTPADSVAESLPVMVWVHGGGLGSGYGHEMEFDGEAIAKRGVILVTINYRVDVLGWFAHPELSREHSGGVSGNLWMHDQIAALKWVQRNIGAFGGDPANVTIFGQSAGGSSVVSHLISPHSEGLFAKAIIQSGSFRVGGGSWMTSSLAEGEAWGVKACEILGKTVADLRGMSGVEAYEALHYAQDHGAGPMPRQLIDPYLFPVEPTKAFLTGFAKNVPVMVGSVSGDKSLFPKPPIDPDKKVYQIVETRLDEKTQAFFARFPADGEGAAIARIIDDAGPIFNDQVVAEFQTRNGHHPVYVYYFDATIPERNTTSFVPDGEAYHSAEMWYIFSTLERCWRRFDGRHYDLSHCMSDYWTQFAKTGDPNASGLPGWPAYTGGQKMRMHFNEERIFHENIQNDALDQFFDFWTAAFGC